VNSWGWVTVTSAVKAHNTRPRRRSRTLDRPTSHDCRLGRDEPRRSALWRRHGAGRRLACHHRVVAEPPSTADSSENANVRLPRRIVACPCGLGRLLPVIVRGCLEADDGAHETRGVLGSHAGAGMTPGRRLGSAGSARTAEGRPRLMWVSPILSTRHSTSPCLQTSPSATTRSYGLFRVHRSVRPVTQIRLRWAATIGRLQLRHFGSSIPPCGQWRADGPLQSACPRKATAEFEAGLLHWDEGDVSEPTAGLPDLYSSCGTGSLPDSVESRGQCFTTANRSHARSFQSITVPRSIGVTTSVSPSQPEVVAGSASPVACLLGSHRRPPGARVVSRW